MGELKENPIRRIVNSVADVECLDTGIRIVEGKPQRCLACDAAMVNYSEGAVRLAVRLWWMQDQNIAFDIRLLKLARFLTHATFEQPIQGKVLRAHFSLPARSLKGFIEQMRAEWDLPIGSFREPPYGYYWMRSPDEFKHWLRTSRAQAMTELTTGYRLFKAVYPELAGQEQLDFARDFSRDLEEAIK